MSIGEHPIPIGLFTLQRYIVTATTLQRNPFMATTLQRYMVMATTLQRYPVYGNDPSVFTVSSARDLSDCC